MTHGGGTLRALAAWAASLTAADVPAEVADLARAQRRSVLAAAAAATDDGAARRVRNLVADRAGSGPAPLPGAAGGVRVEDALYAWAAWSIAQDYDDYACFAHPGHAAVLVPVLLAAEITPDGPDLLAAQVAADEVACRLGGLCLLGPQNGQLWTFVHAAAAAVAAGRMLGLGPGRMAHALALALSQPPRATAPALAGPDSKLLLAAEPAVAGLRAALLAARDVTGPADVLTHPAGFPASFAHAPLPGMLTQLGEGWAMRTLSVKPTPGCAYLTPVLAAVAEIGSIDPEAVRRVTVEAALPTIVMDSLTAGRRRPTPVTVTFSTPWAVAVALHAGRLGPEQLDGRWLETHRHALEALAARVEVRHDVRLSAMSARAFGTILPLRRLLSEAGPVGVLTALRAAAPTVGSSLVGDGLRTVLALLRSPGRLGSGRWWPDGALASFRMVLPARVRVTMHDGHTHAAVIEVPPGAAGSRALSPREAGRTKLAREGPRLWEGRVGDLDAAIAEGAPDLWRLMASDR